MATQVYRGLALAFLGVGVAFVACGPSASSDDPTPSTTVPTPPPATTTSSTTTTTTVTPPPATPSPCDGPGDAYVSQSLNNGICETAAPPNCLINEFSANFMCAEGNPGVGDCDTCCWGDETSLSGGAFTYQDGASDAPSYTHAGGDSIVFSGVTTEYSGFGLWFGPCTDASMWDGLELQITGDLGGGKLVAQLQTDQNYPMEDTKGSCDFVALGADEDTKWNVCTNPQADVGEITADGLMPIHLPWSAFTGGTPVSEVDPQQLRGIQIQVGCGGEEGDTGSSAGSTDTGASSAAPAGPCTFNLEIHDLRWYKNETP